MVFSEERGGGNKEQVNEKQNRHIILFGLLIIANTLADFLGLKIIYFGEEDRISK